jgi:ketopantoate reductase
MDTPPERSQLHVLVIEAGVIGTVYGAQLVAAGHAVAILVRGPRADEVARDGLLVRDALDGTRLSSAVTPVRDVSGGVYDLVLVAVRGEQLGAACDALRALAGQPTLLFFGNNPAGHAAIPPALPGTARLGFPGIGGSLRAGVAHYLRIPQQPTALEAGASRTVDRLAGALWSRGFAVERVADMDGWLLYHAVFVASVAAALHRCGGDTARLADDRATLTLLCRAVGEGFAALRRRRVRGCPRNLALLHRAPLRPFAVWYWARTMRSPLGELCFAAHARHAGPEMRALGDAALARIGRAPGTRHLHQLLDHR